MSKESLMKIILTIMLSLTLLNIAQAKPKSRTIDLDEKFECFHRKKQGYRKIDEIKIALDGNTILTTIEFEGEGFKENDFSLGPIYTKYKDHFDYFKHLFGGEYADEDHSDENILGYLEVAGKDDPLLGNCRKVASKGAVKSKEIKDDARAAEVDLFIDGELLEDSNSGGEATFFD